MSDRGQSKSNRLRECKARADTEIDGAGTATEAAEERGADSGWIAAITSDGMPRALRVANKTAATLKYH